MFAISSFLFLQIFCESIFVQPTSSASFPAPCATIDQATRTIWKSTLRMYTAVPRPHHQLQLFSLLSLRSNSLNLSQYANNDTMIAIEMYTDMAIYLINLGQLLAIFFSQSFDIFGYFLGENLEHFGQFWATFWIVSQHLGQFWAIFHSKIGHFWTKFLSKTDF